MHTYYYYYILIIHLLITYYLSIGVKASTLELELERLRQELSEAHLAISERDAQLGAQEQAIQDLNFTIDSATDELKVRRHIYMYNNNYM